MDFTVDVIQKVVEYFNKKNDLYYRAELTKADGYKLLVTFMRSEFSDSFLIDDKIVEFLYTLNAETGKQFDLVRLFRPDDNFYIAVIVQDVDRLKEVVDFGFTPFDLIL
ncbi:MAG: hypothetical protein ABIM20_05255 [candidate division WOR-3 bacterium]